MRLRAATFVLLNLVLAAATWQAPASSAPGCGERRYGWTSAQAPVAPQAFAVADGGRIYVAGPRILFASEGLGCAWSQVWRMPDVPTPDSPTQRSRSPRSPRRVTGS